MRNTPTVDQLIQDTNLRQKAGILRSSDQRPKLSLRVPIQLDNARSESNPLVIIQPFNGFYVEEATDSTTEVKMGLGSTDNYNTGNYSTLKQNDAAFSPEEIRGCTLFWDAQAGKEIVLVFYVGLEFRPGSLLSVITGGVTVTDGDALSSAKLQGDVATIACPGGSATQILAADADRKVNYLYIDSPAWIGDASVAPGARGVLYQAGLIEWRSPAAAYLYPVAGVVNVFGNDFR